MKNLNEIYFIIYEYEYLNFKTNNKKLNFAKCKHYKKLLFIIIFMEYIKIINENL